MATRRNKPAGGGPRPGGPPKPPPSARTLVPSSGTVTLEEVLVGFQRSLARATRNSLETARADWQVGLGQRSLYVVDSIGVTLQTGVIAAVDAAGQVQSLSLDLGQTPAQGAATLQFSVQSRPIEALSGEQLVLADADPLGHRRPKHALRFTLIGDRHRAGPADAPRAPSWMPLDGRKIAVTLIGGDTGQTETLELVTNPVGQVDLEIDAATNRVTGPRLDRTLQTLDLIERDDDFFVYASWDSELPVEKDGKPRKITSNVVQFWVTRDRPAAPKENR
ncbi:MAG: hypothetical protein JNL87_08565 [Burkholderiaceae bacterium]|nr:hypothetical protein [Burkholderiaceae bacterium]